MCFYLYSKILRDSTYARFGWLFFGEEGNVFCLWKEMSIHDQGRAMWLLCYCAQMLFCVWKKKFVTKTSINCIIFHNYLLYTLLPRFPVSTFLELSPIDVGHCQPTCFGPLVMRKYHPSHIQQKLDVQCVEGLCLSGSPFYHKKEPGQDRALLQDGSPHEKTPGAEQSYTIPTVTNK